MDNFLSPAFIAERNGAKTPYNSDFYQGHLSGSRRAAEVVAQLILQLITVDSVIDIGCGIGTWASQFMSAGIEDVIGVDGDYVERSMLMIPQGNFVIHDLSRPFRTSRKFDLALCLEVGEHLPNERAEGLVLDLVTLSPFVLFSAAVPCQGGTDHINEQYLTYWVDLFAQQGYTPFDFIRPVIWNDNSVPFWYRQNIMLFGGPGHRPKEAPISSSVQDLIHPALYESCLRQVSSPKLGFLIRSIPGAVRRSLRDRTGHLWSRVRRAAEKRGAAS